MARLTLEMTASNVLRMFFSWAWAATSVPINDTRSQLLDPWHWLGFSDLT
jgi:hypothetical protein